MQAWLLSIVREASRTRLLVTHDVEEALLLADVVIVFSARPGRVAETLTSDFPEGKNRRETISGREFVDPKNEALAALEC